MRQGTRRRVGTTPAVMLGELLCEEDVEEERQTTGGGTRQGVAKGMARGAAEEEEEEDPPTFVSQVVDLCRCVVCHTVATDACHCVRGHVTCKECLTRQAAASRSYDALRCALCRSRAAWSQALVCTQLLELAEAHAGAPLLRCEHCEAAVRVGAMEAHRRACGFRMVSCPHPRCSVERHSQDLAEHVLHAHAADVVVVPAGDPFTLVATNFGVQRVVVVRHGDGRRAVLHLDCVGAIGRAGPFEMQQALIRLCCVTPSEVRWKAVVHNRLPDATCEVCETSRTTVPTTPDIASCRAIGHATVLADCDAPLDDSLVHVGRDVAAWWNSSALEPLRQTVRCRDDSFPRAPRRWADASVLMVSVTITM